MAAGYAMVAGFCAQRVRCRVPAGLTAAAVFVGVSVAGLWLIPAARHHGPLRGLVVLVATVVAVYALTAVTRWKRRDGTPPLVEQDTAGGIATR